MTKSLVLSGGGAKGAVHLGALSELEKETSGLGMIVGTSIGAMVAAGFALTLDTQVMMRYALAMNEKVPINLNKPRRVPRLTACWFSNTFRSAFPRFLFFRIVERVFYGRRFEDTKIPLYITAFNLDRKKTEIFSTGELTKPLLASMAIPGLFPPVKIGDDYYCDGGILENLPVRSARLSGADRILAFHLVAKEKTFHYDSNLDSTSLLFRIDGIRDKWMKKTTHTEDAAIIEFETGDYSAMDFRHTPELIEIGKKTVRARIDEIREWLR
jgi:NTE family protein